MTTFSEQAEAAIQIPLSSLIVSERLIEGAFSKDPDSDLRRSMLASGLETCRNSTADLIEISNAFPAHTPAFIATMRGKFLMQKASFLNTEPAHIQPYNFYKRVQDTIAQPVAKQLLSSRELEIPHADLTIFMAQIAIMQLWNRGLRKNQPLAFLTNTSEVTNWQLEDEVPYSIEIRAHDELRTVLARLALTGGHSVRPATRLHATPIDETQFFPEGDVLKLERLLGANHNHARGRLSGEEAAMLNGFKEKILDTIAPPEPVKKPVPGPAAASSVEKITPRNPAKYNALAKAYEELDAKDTIGRSYKISELTNLAIACAISGDQELASEIINSTCRLATDALYASDSASINERYRLEVIEAFMPEFNRFIAGDKSPREWSESEKIRRKLKKILETLRQEEKMPKGTWSELFVAYALIDYDEIHLFPSLDAREAKEVQTDFIRPYFYIVDQDISTDTDENADTGTSTRTPTLQYIRLNQRRMPSGLSHISLQCTLPIEQADLLDNDARRYKTIRSNVRTAFRAAVDELHSKK